MTNTKTKLEQKNELVLKNADRFAKYFPNIRKLAESSIIRIEINKFYAKLK